MTSKDLLPCPFCGETPTISKHFKEDLWSMIHRCEVIGPITIGWSGSMEYIIETWNTRSPKQHKIGDKI
jgi:hypothetical protein